MARIAFSALIYEIVGKLGGSVFQYSYGGWQVHVKNSPRNPQTKYQQLRRGDFGFLAASWRNLTSLQRQTFIDAAVTAPAAFNLFVTTNVNLILINQPTVTSYIPTSLPVTMPVVVDELSPGTFTIKASTVTTIVPAGSSLLVYATNLKAPTKIFTNPSQYSPIAVFPAGSNLSTATSILSEYIARFGQINADLRLCIKSVLIDTTNGSRGAESINCTISDEMAKFVKLTSFAGTVTTSGTGVLDAYNYDLPAGTFTQIGDCVTFHYGGTTDSPVVGAQVAWYIAGTGYLFFNDNIDNIWVIDITVMRISGNQIRWSAVITKGSTVLVTEMSVENSINFAAVIPTKLTLQASGSGYVEALFGTINKELL